MQHRKSLVWFGSLMILLSAVIGISSCKKKFDEPAGASDPDITVTHTIKAFKAKHTVAGAYDIITEDIVISGTVIANDKSGNIYKQVYIQDETGALAVNLDALSTYTSFPVGRKVFIKCKGLCLSDVSKMIQLGIKSVVNGTPSLEGIPSTLIGQYVLGGSLNNPVTPKVVTSADLGGSTINMQDQYIGSLVQLDNYEFQTKNSTYADTSVYKTTTNQTIKNCSGVASSNLIVRTSGYASFAAVNVPDGNGSIVAIYTVFSNTKQMILRDTTDVKFYGTPCGGGGGGDAPFISIADLRAKHTGTDITITSNRIKGIVLSDASNIGAGNIVLQDGNAGIDLFFGTGAAGALSAFKVGDSLVVDISGGSLELYNGMLEVVLNSTAVPATAAGTALTGSGKSVSPVTYTVAQIGTNMATIENTLVRIENGTATPAGATYADGTFAGNRTLTDASGNMTLRTLASASFGATAMPVPCQNWVGYVSRFNTTNQIYIRTLADVTAGTACGTPPPTGGISLGSTSPYLMNFNSIGSGLPQGVFVKTGANATALGTDATFNASAAPAPPAANINIWKKTNGGFKNFASAINTGFTTATDSATQAAAPDRALGVRQVSATDKEVAFVFLIDNTTGKNNLALEFLLQSLDDSSPRVVTWFVDYATGDNPTSFTPATTGGGPLTTGGSTFTNNTVTATFGGALDNKTGKVWIRIITTAGSTGASNRPSTAIDNFKVTWN